MIVENLKAALLPGYPQGGTQGPFTGVCVEQGPVVAEDVATKSARKCVAGQQNSINLMG